MFHKMRKLKHFEKIVFGILIALAVVSFWRGAGGLMNIYLFPNNVELSYWISITISFFILGLSHYWTKEYSLVNKHK